MTSGEVRGVWFGVRSGIASIFSGTAGPAASKDVHNGRHHIRQVFR